MKEKEAGTEAVVRLKAEFQRTREECKGLENQKASLTEEIRKLRAQKEVKRLEYQKVSEQKTAAEQELIRLEEEYRLPRENLEKKQALLEELFRKMTGDPVLMGDWKLENESREEKSRLSETRKETGEELLDLIRHVLESDGISSEHRIFQTEHPASRIGYEERSLREICGIKRTDAGAD